MSRLAALIQSGTYTPTHSQSAGEEPCPGGLWEEADHRFQDGLLPLSFPGPFRDRAPRPRDRLSPRCKPGETQSARGGGRGGGAGGRDCRVGDDRSRSFFPDAVTAPISARLQTGPHVGRRLWPDWDGAQDLGASALHGTPDSKLYTGLI